MGVSSWVWRGGARHRILGCFPAVPWSLILSRLAVISGLVAYKCPVRWGWARAPGSSSPGIAGLAGGVVATKHCHDGVCRGGANVSTAPGAISG